MFIGRWATGAHDISRLKWHDEWTECYSYGGRPQEPTCHFSLFDRMSLLWPRKTETIAKKKKKTTLPTNLLGDWRLFPWQQYAPWLEVTANWLLIQPQEGVAWYLLAKFSRHSHASNPARLSLCLPTNKESNLPNGRRIWPVIFIIHTEYIHYTKSVRGFFPSEIMYHTTFLAEQNLMPCPFTLN